MPITAIRYGIKAGCEDQIAEIFAGFKRTGTPVVLDADGNEAGRILSTAVFIENDIMVRFVEYEGDLADIARFMATQPGVREVERRLKPYLAKPRDTGTVEGFTKTFERSTMRCISQLSADEPDGP
ncbi:SchA/CurD-like domain-containing protein [Amycolatopsis japonica]